MNPGSGMESRIAHIRDWYEHLTEMGITAIQFGPIFESHSHGYDTIDYFRIDRRLGDLTLFREIIDELHEREIRIILDGVFNHTGRGFFAFKDIQENRHNSAYVDWYDIDWESNTEFDDGFSYQSWEGHNALPRLNINNPDVKQYIFEVSRFWLGDVGVDGWRLDAADQIDPKFWWEFRRTCKQVRPGAFVFGELIHGDYRTYVAPELLDSATNYQIYKPIWSALNDMNMWELKHGLDRAFDSEIGIYQGLSLVNFLSNHDVTRVLSILDNPRHVYLALILLMTIPGIPALYYGDEIGLRGHKDNGDRALRPAMLKSSDEWPDTDRDLFQQLKRLIAFRKAYPALVDGGYAPIDTDNSFFSFVRHHQNQWVIVMINPQDAPIDRVLNLNRESIPDGVVFHDVLNAENRGFSVSEGRLVLDKIEAYWGRILVANV